MTEVQAPKGTLDWLPPDGGRVDALEAAFAARARRYGYRRILTPTFEHTEVFARVGESTDIVRKEMYTFDDRGGRSLTLRPEATAAVVRAFVEHGVAKREPLPWKVFCSGPFFRAEQPQAGRYREFRQVDCEVFGDPSPEVDAELIDLTMAFLTAVGAGPLDLLVNSMGDATCRPAFLELFRAYLSEHEAELCPECRGRIATNPLRVLDCKNPACRAATEAAPRLVDHLCDACQAHFDGVTAALDELGWRYRIDSRLVRGLDYYTRTTFEVQTSALDAAQNALGGGGRYDGLVAEFGGDPMPGSGFALGCERILLAAPGFGGEPPLEAVVVDVTEHGRAGWTVLYELRRAGVAADLAGRGRSMKAQMRAVERAGAAVAVIVGPEEEARGVVAVRDLRTREQAEVEVGKVADYVRNLHSQ